MDCIGEHYVCMCVYAAYLEGPAGDEERDGEEAHKVQHLADSRRALPRPALPEKSEGVVVK